MGLTQVNSEGIKDGEIKDADVNASAAIAGSKLAAATTSAAGSMSAADKTKLDGVATSATANPSAPALTGSTDNTVCTVTGANAIQGEANLTFDGTKLNVNGGTSNNVLHLESTDGTCSMEFYDNATTNGNQPIVGGIGNNFYVETGGSERLRIHSSGDVEVKTGSLIIGTAGEGIDFAATSDATGKTNERLEDYEEGTFTTSIGMTSTAVTHAADATTSWTGYYVKAGNMCHIHVYVNEAEITGNGAGWMYMGGLPYTSHNGNYCAITITHNTLTYHDVKNGYVQPGNTIMYPVRDDSTGATFCNTGSSRYLMFGGTYRTA